jgi:hypothetical protein
MANGIYTQPIPLRDPNQDLQNLANILANQQALAARNQQARNKALNERKKLVDAEFDYEGKIPTDMLPAFRDFTNDMKQQYSYYLDTGDDVSAEKVLDKFIVELRNFTDYGAAADQGYEAWSEITSAVSGDSTRALNKAEADKLGIGIRYDEENYSASQANKFLQVQRGTNYDLYWNSQNQNWNYIDPSANTGARLENSNAANFLSPQIDFQIFNTKTKANLILPSAQSWAESSKWDTATQRELGASYGYTYLNFLKKAKNPSEIDDAVTAADSNFEKNFVRDFRDATGRRGVELRMQLLAIGTITGDEDLETAFGELTGEQQQKILAGNFEIEGEKIKDDKIENVFQAYKSYIKGLIDNDINIKERISGRSGTDKTLYYLEQGIGFKQGPTSVDQRGEPIPRTVEIEVPLDFQEDRRFRFNIQEDGETFTIQGPTAVAFKFSNNGKLQGMTLQGVVKTKPTDQGSQGTFEEVLDYDVSVTDDNFVQIFTAINQAYAESVKKPLRDSMDDRIEEERNNISYLQNFEITQNFSDLTEVTGQSQSSGI